MQIFLDLRDINYLPQAATQVADYKMLALQPYNSVILWFLLQITMYNIFTPPWIHLTSFSANVLWERNPISSQNRYVLTL